MGRSKRGRNSLQRAQGWRSLSKSIRIVCEGHTEKHVIEQLRQRWRLRGVKVTVIAQGEGPSKVVKRARKETQKHKPDEVWVVFDRDEHADWAEALEAAKSKKNGFLLAVSNPCFELWAVLLHEDQFAHIERNALQRRLAQLHAGYDHQKGARVDLARVAESDLERAEARAEKLLSRAEDNGAPFGNPTTRFHNLVAALRKAKLV